MAGPTVLYVACLDNYSKAIAVREWFVSLHPTDDYMQLDKGAPNPENLPLIREMLRSADQIPPKWNAEKKRVERFGEVRHSLKSLELLGEVKRVPLDRIVTFIEESYDDGNSPS